MAQIPGTNVSGPVVPNDDQDAYPTHDSQYGLGGWREVDSIVQRDAIPVERRRVGMVVYCVGDKEYELGPGLSNDDWTACAVPGSGYNNIDGGEDPAAYFDPLADIDLDGGELTMESEWDG